MKQPGGMRARRVAQRIRASLASSLVRELDDSRLHDLVITDVACTDDLGLATVRVRKVLGEADERTQQRILAALRRAGGKLRHGLAQQVVLERVPMLRFMYDTGPDATRRVEQVLAELQLPEEDDSER